MPRIASGHRHEAVSLLQHLEVTKLASTLIFGSLTSRATRASVSVAVSHAVCGHVWWSPGELSHSQTMSSQEPTRLGASGPTRGKWVYGGGTPLECSGG